MAIKKTLGLLSRKRTCHKTKFSNMWSMIPANREGPWAKTRQVGWALSLENIAYIDQGGSRRLLYESRVIGNSLDRIVI